MASTLVPLTLEQHQQIIYEILYMVDDFCKAHNIPYFLVGGTLLGAVRHQCIIPWDDDADIAMTRENYERFINLFHQEGTEGYELYDLKHKKAYLYPFAKMVKKDSRTSNKISIDIFVYDGCGDNLNEAQRYFLKYRKKTQKFVDCIVNQVPFNKLYDCWKAKLVYFVREFPIDIFMYVPAKLFPSQRKKYINKICSQCASYRVQDTQYSACIVWGIYGIGEVQPSSYFLNLEQMRFGTRELPVPSGWHGYLTGIYGDYMTPLPENKRHQHRKHISSAVVSL